MKRFAFILASLLVLSFGLALAQSVSVEVTGAASATEITEGKTVTFGIRFTNDYVADLKGSTNGFVLKSPDGCTWNAPVPTATGAITADMYDGGFNINPFSWDGLVADTVGFGGFKMFKPGIPVGFDEVVATIEVTVPAVVNIGKTFILDTAFYRPGGYWLWSSTPDVRPAWGGALEFTILELTNEPPQFTNCTPLGALNHCNVATKDFNAVDPTPPADGGPDPITFGLVSGPGTINTSTGVWSYAPTLGDVGVSMSVVVSVCDPFGCGTECTLDLNFTNIAPSFTGGCGANVQVGKGNTAYLQMTAASNDCDPINFSIVSVTPAPVGALTINASTGLITFVTDEADAGTLGQTFDIVVAVSDGLDVTECTTHITVLATEPFMIQIEKTHGTYQGGHETVDITFEAGSEALGGFDFLIAYDASALNFVGALEGNIFADYAWEYFTFRYGADGNCGNGCPSGLLRLVGIAETNNGAYHPNNLYLEVGDVFATLDFLVTDDRTFECMYVPIRFFWMDCGDNSVAYYAAEDLLKQAALQGITRYVFDFDLVGDITDYGTGYPTYTGAQDEDCFVGDPMKIPTRFVDFVNGGIDIICSEEIDARGDINLNEVANEIADAVLFSNYFVYGLGVFTVNMAGQVAATDVNADGLTLSVADLVYLVRIIVGDAQPYAKLAPVATTYTVDNGLISVNGSAGAASFVVRGNTVPTLLADNMEMRYNFDGVNTRVLVYSMEKGASFSGDVLRVNGELVSLDMATYDGAPMTAKVIPSSYALNQNYPNPFNPGTVVSFDMKKAGNYELYIYNVTGQKVASYAGKADAGTVEVAVDGSNWSSGVYFYKVKIDNFTDTKKMVLLK
jgi:hypothetical protein